MYNGNNSIALEHEINTDTRKLNDWLLSDKLTINIEKTNYKYFFRTFN